MASLFTQPNPYQSMASWAVPQYGSTPQPMMSVDPNQPNAMVAPNPSAELYDPIRSGFDMNINTASTTQPNSWMPDWLKGAVGTKEAPGWGGMAMGAASGLANAFMGMKQYGLAKDTLANNKQQFQMQYDAQKQMTNSNLEDRQRARVASNPGAYQSVGDYMTKYGVK